MNSPRHALVSRLLWALLCLGCSCAHTLGPHGLPNEIRTGIVLAQLGHPEKAASRFTSLLSVFPGDPRVLNDLGNVHLLNGDPVKALACYDSAAAGDSSDAGVRINRAIALLLVGQSDSAAAEAASAKTLAGGEERARLLLEQPLDARYVLHGMAHAASLHGGNVASEMSSRLWLALWYRGRTVSEIEIRALLAGARPTARTVDPDTSRAAVNVAAGLEESDAVRRSALLYWKH